MNEAMLNVDDLPSTWALTNLGSVVNYGSTIKAEPVEIADEAWVLELEDIEKDSSRVLQRRTFAQRQSRSTKNSFQAGDVLYGKLRPYLNKVVIADQAGYCTTEIVPIEAGLALDHRYLFYWLKHPAFLKYVEAESHGMNMPRLGTDSGKAAPLVLAPRGEQTRIADQLDTLLARVQACNDRFDAIPSLLKRLKAAAITAAVSGDFSDDREPNVVAHDAGERFPVVHIVDALAEPLRNGKSVRDGVGLPVLRLTALRSQTVDLNEFKQGDWSGVANVSRFLIHNGDYLVSRGNGSKDYVGRGGLVSGCTTSMAFPDTMIRFRPNPAVLLAAYLSVAWESEGVREQIARAAKTTAGIWKVSQTDLERITIHLPTLDEQSEIVGRVEALFHLADRIEARYTAARTQAQRLTPLLLAKAFRGELVPQDPNDEPANVLLKRIAAKRGKAASSTITNLRRTPCAADAMQEITAMTKSRFDDDVTGHGYLARHLCHISRPTTAEELFKVAELPAADFYKQLAWEVAQGHVKEKQTLLEPGDAA